MGKNNARKPANDGFSAPARASKNVKKQGSKKTVISVICMVLVIALFGGVIIFNKVADSGYFYRNTVSVSSENFEVNNAMLSYFFNAQYQNMYSSLEQMGVDLEQNLKDQKYTKDMSWFDFIMQSYTIPQVEQLLVLCEAAKAAGFELDEHEKEHAEEAVKSIEDTAASYADSYNTSAKQSGGAANYTADYFIRQMYGYGVTIDDIRDAIELNQLAAAYSTHISDGFEFSAEEWSNYLEEHKADFQVIDYVSYTFEAKKATSASTTTTATTAATEKASGASNADETTTAATTTTATTGLTNPEKDLSPEKYEVYKKAYNLSQHMMADSDKALEIFNTEVKKHLEEVVYADETDADKKAEKVAEAMDGLAVEAAANDESSDFLKYAFSKDRDKATYVAEDNTNGKYTVYLITKLPYIEEYLTRDIRVIALSATDGDKVSEKRDTVIKEFEKGDKSEKSFEELAAKYSEDSTAHETGGLYENQGKNDLSSDELSKWLFSADRKVGDYTSVSNGEKDTNEVIYIAYYVGEGLKKWERDVDVTMISEAYEKEYEKLEKAHKVTTDLEEAYKIPSQAGLA